MEDKRPILYKESQSRMKIPKIITENNVEADPYKWDLFRLTPSKDLKDY